MNKLLVMMLCVLAIAARAQVGPDTAVAPVDTIGLRPDTAQRAVLGSVDYTLPPDPVRATRAREEREERASMRSSGGPQPSSPSSSSSGRTMKRSKEGPQLNVQRATDPEGRKHWKRMNKRATRRSPDSPPGTVPPN